MGQVARHPARVRSLTWLQHALLAVLLAVATARAVAERANPWGVAGALLAFLVWYAVGVRLARSPERGRATRGPVWWLGGLLLLWVLLVVVSPAYAWVAFPLWLLIGHFLDLVQGIVVSALVLGVVLWATVSPDAPTVAAVLGPAIGSVFALVISRGQLQLVRDGLERQRLVDSLVRAQTESEALHAELAEAQRESGALAERTRLSRDIHDGLAQTFSSILLTAGSGLSGDPRDADALRAALDQVRRSAQDGLEESRRVVGALAPRDLADTGLTAALRRTLAAFAERTGMDADLQVDGELTSLPTTLEVALLRVAQGSLANVEQHSGARRVVVTLTEAMDSVRLDIVDDGRGFDAVAWGATAPGDPRAGGYGLRSSRDRLRELGGGLEIESAPGEGTALTAYLPLEGQR